MIRRRSRRLAVFQMHHTDAEPRLLETSAVPRVLSSGLFDEVAIAAADVPENVALEPFAEHWGVRLFRGAERDVAWRVLDLARETDADVVARMLVWWFFVDVDLLARQLEALEASDAELLTLPRDFDLRFGADVFRPGFLERALEELADADASDAFRMNPWSLAEARPERFRLEEFADVPTYDRARYDATRETMRALWPDRWDGAATPLSPYRIALEHLPVGGRALDVACGLGAGTALLGARGDALGVDLAPEAIERCTARYGEVASFRAGDALALDVPEAAFDVVVSVHTMEHLGDDDGFLANVERWLVPGGRLVLEVPLLAKRPFVGLGTPLSPGHVREYDADELVAQVGERFEIERTLGVARGAYLPLERARSSALIVGRKR